MSNVSLCRNPDAVGLIGQLLELREQRDCASCQLAVRAITTRSALRQPLHGSWHSFALILNAADFADRRVRKYPIRQATFAF